MHNFLPPHSASLHPAFGYILWTFPCVNLINSFPRESFVLAFFEHFEHFWTFFNRMWEVSPLLLGSGRSDQLGREGCWAASEVCDPNNGAAGRWSRASLFGLWNSELGVWYVLICFDGFCSFFFQEDCMRQWKISKSIELERLRAQNAQKGPEHCHQTRNSQNKNDGATTLLWTFWRLHETFKLPGRIPLNVL